MFDVITLITPKGGTGKSTLARALAAHWMQLGFKPALIDADPQSSLAQRYNPDGPMKDVPIRAEPEEQRIAEVIEELKADQRRPVIIDTAGFRNRTAIMALVAADLAIIPVKPAVEDMEAAVSTYDLIQEISGIEDRGGRPLQAVMVLTMTMSGTVIARHARSQLLAKGYPLLQAEMANRVAYPEAGIDGLSPSILAPDGPAARDIAAIASEIMKLNNHESMKVRKVANA